MLPIDLHALQKNIENHILEQRERDSLLGKLGRISNQASFDRALGRVGAAKKSSLETALQRQLLAAGVSHCGNFGKISWLDGELPLEFRLNKNGAGSARSVCLDLIGRTGRDEFVLCELKRGGKGALNEAVLQLLVYEALIQRNQTELETRKIHHAKSKLFNWTEIFGSGNTAGPRLLVLADQAWFDAFHRSRKRMGRWSKLKSEPDLQYAITRLSFGMVPDEDARRISMVEI